MSTSATTTGAYTPSMYSIGRTGANLRRRAPAAGPRGLQAVSPLAPAAERHRSAITIGGVRVGHPARAARAMAAVEEHRVRGECSLLPSVPFRLGTPGLQP